MVPKLATLTHGEQFVYEFDFADRWTHLCTAAPTRIPRQNWNHSERSAAALGVGNDPRPKRAPLGRRRQRTR